jgi:hypothetical protein
MEPNFHHHAGGPRSHSGLIPGVILVTIGALFFLNNLHLVYVREWLRFWPAILIAIGIVKLVDSTFTGGRVAGGVLVGVGAILLAQALGFLDGLRMRDMWPLFLIGLGVLLLFQRGMNWPDTWADRTRSAGWLNEVAIFGGGKRSVTGQNFRGGHISAVFGGFEIDLRKAVIEGEAAVMDIDAIFGGVEVKIPENWSAVIQGTGIFGGYADSTVQPAETTPGFKRIFFKGSAVFGGVEVKN